MLMVAREALLLESCQIDRTSALRLVPVMNFVSVIESE
jgi:hypothetical protein